MCRPARSNFAGDEVWVQPEFGRRGCREPYWRQRLEEGMAHTSAGLVIAKAMTRSIRLWSAVEIVRQKMRLVYEPQSRSVLALAMDHIRIVTAVGNSLAILPEPETYLALFHGVRRVAIDCDGEAPARQRSCLSSRRQSYHA